MKKLSLFLTLFLLIPTLCFGTVADSYSPEKYTGNGSTDEFSFSWTLIADSNIRVYLENISTGVQTAQTLDSDFTVSFDDDTPGGTVTFTTPPTSSYYVIISREISKTQSTPYTTSSGFRAKVVEASLDKLTAQTQDLQEQLDRSLKLPLGTSEGSITFPEPEADKVVGWNSGGTALENKDGLDEAVTAAEAAQTAAETAETNASTSATSASTSATNASTAQTAAETAQAAAEAAAAGVNLPSISPGDSGKILKVNAGESGYDLVTTTSILEIQNESYLVGRNAADDGDVNLIGANASDERVIPGGFIMPEDTAPVTGENEGGFFFKNDGTQTEAYFKEESDGDEVQITKGGRLNACNLVFDTTQVFASAGAPTTYTDLDLSSVVGSNKAIVILRVESNSATTDYRFRENGMTDDMGLSENSQFGGGCSAATVANGRSAYVIVPTDSSGIIEWVAQSANTTIIYMVAYIT